MHFHSPIAIGLLIYLGITFAIRIIAAKKIKGSSKNFLIAGGALPFSLLIFAQM